MPALTHNKMLGALRFAGHGLVLPEHFEDTAKAERDRYVALLKPEERVAVPQLIPAWYKPAMPIGPHQKICDTIGQGWKDLHDTMCDAVRHGHDMWRLQAKFAPMPIAGAAVSGQPQCLTGPPLEGLVLQYPACAAMSSSQTPYRDAIAKGVSQAFAMWQAAVTVPGLPLFPAYSRQPQGPVVPATSVPQKLVACVSAQADAIAGPSTMKRLMLTACAPGLRKDNPNLDPILDAVSTVISLGFVQWLANQLVIGLMGTGAVATAGGGPVVGMTRATSGNLVS